MRSRQNLFWVTLVVIVMTACVSSDTNQPSSSKLEPKAIEHERVVSLVEKLSREPPIRTTYSGPYAATRTTPTQRAVVAEGPDVIPLLTERLRCTGSFDEAVNVLHCLFLLKAKAATTAVYDLQSDIRKGKRLRRDYSLEIDLSAFLERAPNW